MRIVQLSTMMSYYGGEVHLADLARGLRDRGHQVLCVVRPGSALGKHLPQLGLKVQELPLVDWFDPTSVARLSRLLRRWGCQILHTHLPRDYFLAAVATLGSPVVNVGTRHQLQPISHPFLKRPFLNRFAGFIAVSEAVRQGMLQGGCVPDEKLSVIHHGLAVDSASSADKWEAARLRLQAGVGASTPLIGFVGRLCPTKGLETLIEAIALLKPRWPRLKVMIIGAEAPGSRYGTTLSRMISRRGLGEDLILGGYRPGAARLSRAFDIQVVPSRAEPFGLVTLEGMAAGVPMVVSDTGGSPEILRDGVEGFLFPAGQADVLARKLDCLLDSPGLRREMGRRGRERVARAFNPGAMLERTLEVYWRSLGQARPGERAPHSA